MAWAPFLSPREAGPCSRAGGRTAGGGAAGVRGGAGLGPVPHAEEPRDGDERGGGRGDGALPVAEGRGERFARRGEEGGGRDGARGRVPLSRAAVGSAGRGSAAFRRAKD